MWTWVIWSQKGHFSLPLRLLNNPYSTEAPPSAPPPRQSCPDSTWAISFQPVLNSYSYFSSEKTLCLTFVLENAKKLGLFCPSTWPFWVWEAPRGFFAKGYNWTCCSWMAKVWLLGYDQVYALRQQTLLQPKYKNCLWHFYNSKRKCTAGGPWRTLRGHMRIPFVKR